MKVWAISEPAERAIITGGKGMPHNRICELSSTKKRSMRVSQSIVQWLTHLFQNVASETANRSGAHLAGTSLAQGM